LKECGCPDTVHSPSAIESYITCPRRWGWRKIALLPDETSDILEFGKALHKQIELYLTTGQPLDLTSKPGLAAMAGLHLLPQPKTPGMQVEKHFRVGPFHGYKDIDLPGEVLDHKTTSDIDKWSKTPDELVTNIQAAIYALDAMGLGETARLRWVYYHRNPPFKAKAVDRIVTVDEIRPTIVRAKSACDEMNSALTKRLHVLQLPFNPSACYLYNRPCPYITHCNITPEERLAAMTMNPMQQAFLASLPGGGQGPAVNPPNHAPGAYPPPGAQLDPTGKLWWDPTPGADGPGSPGKWRDVVAQAAPPPPPPPAPPPPPPVQQAAPPPPPPPAQQLALAPPPPPIPQVNGTANAAPTPDDENPGELIASGLELIANGIRLLLSTPAKRGPGRPRKS
jgi:hypothetical protein